MKLITVEQLGKDEKKEIIKNAFKSVYELWILGVITKAEYKAIKEKCKVMI